MGLQGSVLFVARAQKEKKTKSNIGHKADVERKCTRERRTSPVGQAPALAARGVCPKL